MDSVSLPDFEILLRLGLATFLGYLIGLERQLRGQSAGDRTHALAALGAAAFTLLSLTAFPDSESSRVAAQVVVGMGFVAAGVIIRDTSQGQIRGLTTAAGIWAVGAMGMAIGAGQYLIGGTVAVLIFILLVSERLLKIDQRLAQRRRKDNEP